MIVWLEESVVGTSAEICDICGPITLQGHRRETRVAVDRRDEEEVVCIFSVCVLLSDSLVGTSEGLFVGPWEHTTDQWHKNHLRLWSWRQGWGSSSAPFSYNLFP